MPKLPFQHRSVQGVSLSTAIQLPRQGRCSLSPWLAGSRPRPSASWESGVLTSFYLYSTWVRMRNLLGIFFDQSTKAQFSPLFARLAVPISPLPASQPACPPACLPALGALFWAPPAVINPVKIASHKWVLHFLSTHFLEGGMGRSLTALEKKKNKPRAPMIVITAVTIYHFFFFGARFPKKSGKQRDLQRSILFRVVKWERVNKQFGIMYFSRE